MDRLAFYIALDWVALDCAILIGTQDFSGRSELKVKRD